MVSELTAKCSVLCELFSNLVGGIVVAYKKELIKRSFSRDLLVLIL